MNVRKGIFLIGLAGSGKTTLGKQVAHQLGYKFIDLDQRIVEKEGASIPEIFERQGVGQFRLIEREVLHDIVAIEDSYVMATGGGTPCYHFNMDTMALQKTGARLEPTLLSAGDFSMINLV